MNKLRAKLESLERLQNRMKAANAAIRMKDQEKGDAKLAEMGYSPSDIKDMPYLFVKSSVALNLS